MFHYVHWITTVGDLWTPANLTTVHAWYDASDTTTITESGGAVSQWDDKSGNSRHLTQADAGDAFTTGTRTLNSLNALDVTNDTMIGSSISGASNASHDIFCMIDLDNADGGRQIFELTGSGCAIIPTFSSNIETAFEADGAPEAFLESSAKSTNPMMTNFRSSGTQVSYWLDGTSRVSENLTGTFTFTTLELGVANMNGLWCEFVWCPFLTATDREKMEGYMAHKWGQTANLPVGHPFKNNPPRV